MPPSYGHRPSRRKALALFAAAGALLGLPAGHAAAQEKALKIAVLGDSLSAGYGLPAGAAFPARLQAALAAKGLPTEMVNAGVSGDTTSGGLDRLDWSIPEGTQAVIVELGANDMLRGLDPAIPRKALDEIITRLKARGAAVFLCGMYAQRNLGADYVAKFDAIYPDLAKKHDVPLYPFFLQGVAGEKNLNLPDGLHPTAEGIEIIVRAILPSVEAWLRPLMGRTG